MAIEPTFITNYDQARRLHYLKAGVSLRVEGAAGELAVFQHIPQIRDYLLRVFAGQMVQGMASAEGREMLRQQARQAVRQRLCREAGKDYLQDVLFPVL